MTTEYDYPVAFSCWGYEEREAIARVIASNRFTQGEEVETFEEEFARYHGMKHAIMVNSGSSANLVAVAALFNKQENPLRRGDKAIVPALAWSTTYAPLVHHGLDLVLADCDETWNMMRGGFPYHGERLVMTCPILGNPVSPMTERPFNIPPSVYHIQDCCESIGASINDKRCGTFGMMNTFSFFWSHQLSAIEGGMILTDDDEMNALCRSLRDHGMTRWYKKFSAFDDEYCFTHFGFNVRTTEMHAAIAREQLKRLSLFVQERRSNLAYFWKLADDLPITMPRWNGDPSPFGVHFTVKDTETRARLVAGLRENSIDCRLPTGGSFRLHPYGAKWADQQTPNADHIHRTGLFLGDAPYDISDKIERAVRVMREVL